MNSVLGIFVLCLCLCLSSTASADTDVSKVTDHTGPGHDKVVVCYVASWAVYRPGRGSFGLEHIEPSLCTHLVYAFAGLNITTNSIYSLDPYNDLEEAYGKGSFKKMTAMRQKHPHLKVTLAIGGWNEGSANYSILAASPDRRQAFIRSVSSMIRKHSFDGLDLDWEFPGKRGGAADDKSNFVLLVKELRTEFDKHGWLLTAALGAGLDTIELAYDVPALSQYLDLMHIMCYDYHGSWDKQTGVNSPLKAQMDKLSVDDSIQYLIKMGAPRHKLVLGLSMYGRTFIMSNPEDKDTEVLGMKAEEKGFQGPLTREDGFLGYNEICTELGAEDSEWKQHYDPKTETPYAINGNKVITYDSPRSLSKKVKYAVTNNLAGLMIWAIDNDDFHGDCDEQTGEKYPLMRTVNQAVFQAIREQENLVIEERERDGKKNAAPAMPAGAHQLCVVALVFTLGRQL